MRKAVAFGVFLVCAVVFGTGSEVSAVWEQADQLPNVSSYRGAGFYNDSPCGGRWQIVSIGNETYRACVYGEPIGMRFILYASPSGLKPAVQFPYELHSYPVRGICEDGLGCYYSAVTDTLLSKEYGDFSRFNGVLHRSFSQDLVFDSGTREYRWVGPKGETVRDVNGAALEINAASIATSGEWAVFEWRNRGIVRLNVQTGETTRVLAPGYPYGVGRDPSMEVGISNDGSTVALSGRNVGFVLVRVTNDCGDEPTLQSPAQFSSASIPCQKTGANIHTIPGGFSYASNLHFSLTQPNLVINVLQPGNKKLRVTISSQPVVTQEPFLLGMGDSFSSGEGESSDEFYLPYTNTADEKCHVSRRSYPLLLANSLGLPSLNIACSGARMIDMTANPVGYTGQKDRLADRMNQPQLREEARQLGIPGRIPQKEFVQSLQPSHVTIGIGGNDAGIIQKVIACMMPTTCHWVDPERLPQIADEIDALAPRLIDTVTQITEASPTTHVAIVGYPIPIDLDGECDIVTDTLLNAQERRWLVEIIQRLNQVLRYTAQRTGVSYGDIESVYEHRGVCGASEPKAFQMIRLGDDIAPIPMLESWKLIGTESFHPKPYGHQLAATQLQARAFSEPQSPNEDAQLPERSQYWLGNASSSRLISMDIVENTTIENGTLEILTPEMVFDEGSSVLVSLYSQAHDLGEVGTDESGRVVQTLTLPVDIQPGYHSVMLSGESRSGEKLEVYQTIQVLSRDESITSEAAPILEMGSVMAEKYDVLKTTKNQDTITFSSSAELPASSGSVQSARTLKDTEHKINKSLIIVIVLAGIILVWLLYVLLLRKLFQRVFLRKSNHLDTS